VNADDQPATQLVYIQLRPDQIKAVRELAQWAEVGFDVVVSECAKLYLERRGAARPTRARTTSARKEGGFA
jgi:hypothetical protein